MNLPDNWMLFRSLVLEKTKTYCSLGIWPFEYDTFTAWLSNFTCNEDEYIALHLIDGLIVRSYKMAICGYARLFRSDLRQFLIEKGLIDSSMNVNQWMANIKSKWPQEQINFIPLRSGSENGESGPAIYRSLSDYIPTGSMPTNIDAQSEGKIYVIIDDFTGSGDQFNEYCEKEDNLIDSICENNTVIFSPLIAHDRGIEAIKSKHPLIRVLPVEVIHSDQDVFFNREGDEKFRNDTLNTINDIALHYESMKSRYASPNMAFWMGRDNMGLPLAFEWGCPNQTCSILWMETTPKSRNWQQLFSRRS